jgi:hypothetical protein
VGSSIPVIRIATCGYEIDRRNSEELLKWVCLNLNFVLHQRWCDQRPYALSASIYLPESASFLLNIAPNFETRHNFLFSSHLTTLSICRVIRLSKLSFTMKYLTHILLAASMTAGWELITANETIASTGSTRGCTKLEERSEYYQWRPQNRQEPQGVKCCTFLHKGRKCDGAPVVDNLCAREEGNAPNFFASFSVQCN